MTGTDQTRWMQTADTLKSANQLISVQSFSSAVLRLSTASHWASDIQDPDLRGMAQECIEDVARYLADEMASHLPPELS